MSIHCSGSSRFRQSRQCRAERPRRTQSWLISTKDLEALQKRAFEEGLTYQTLISSLWHKYASGKVRDPAARVCPQLCGTVVQSRLAPPRRVAIRRRAASRQTSEAEADGEIKSAGGQPV